MNGLAIFPLSTILFPGGVLPLRVFETRYMDMVRECMKEDRPFGVCQISQGHETGLPAEHEQVGCLAAITQWDMEQLGLLHLRVCGVQRFRIVERYVEKSALIRANVALLDDDPEVPVPPDLHCCRDLVRRLVAQLEQEEPRPDRRLVARPYSYDSASWIGNRLCEFLPIPPKAKQRLMEIDEPLTRLYLVKQFLEKEQIL
ncbi:MAG: LON peptidase substrate-binding domain-containing protein [Lautropia sp.]|nr:LON peptidase substrate-binding domain-containing protein [Lautropia sp.]